MRRRSSESLDECVTTRKGTDGVPSRSAREKVGKRRRMTPHAVIRVLGFTASVGEAGRASAEACKSRRKDETERAPPHQLQLQLPSQSPSSREQITLGRPRGQQGPRRRVQHTPRAPSSSVSPGRRRLSSRTLPSNAPPRLLREGPVLFQDYPRQAPSLHACLPGPCPALRPKPCSRSSAASPGKC